MGAHTVDRVVAVLLPRVDGMYEDNYLVAQMGGDNNVRERDTGRRARNWYAAALGMEWEVISRAARMSSDCAGGMLKIAGRGETTPESFIRLYRTALKNAIPLHEAAELQLIITGQICVPKESNEPLHKYMVDQVSGGMKPLTEIDSYGTKMLTAEYDLRSPTELAAWWKIHPGKASWAFKVKGNVHMDPKQFDAILKGLLERKAQPA